MRPIYCQSPQQYLLFLHQKSAKHRLHRLQAPYCLHYTSTGPSNKQNSSGDLTESRRRLLNQDIFFHIRDCPCQTGSQSKFQACLSSGIQWFLTALPGFHLFRPFCSIFPFFHLAMTGSFFPSRHNSLPQYGHILCIRQCQPKTCAASTCFHKGAMSHNHYPAQQDILHCNLLLLSPHFHIFSQTRIPECGLRQSQAHSPCIFCPIPLDKAKSLCSLCMYRSRNPQAQLCLSMIPYSAALNLSIFLCRQNQGPWDSFLLSIPACCFQH